MANVVKLKRGTGSDPTASDMVVGEPVIRTDTAELFFKKDDGSVAKVSGGGGGPDFVYLALRNAANNGAASYPGNDFTLVESGTTTAVSPAAASALLVSYGGVIQQPNAGTSTSGITGFIVDGSRIKTATNFTAAPDFILYQEAGGIGEPSDNTVSEAKLNVSNSPTNGYFLSAQSGNTGGLTWAAISQYSTPLTTQGDILFRDGSGDQRLAAGTNGYFLKTQGSGADPVWSAVPAGVTINNNADNRVITGSGTANTLNGESNFTFDGTNLVLAEGVEVKLGTSSNLEIISINGNKARIQSQQEDFHIETAASKSIVFRTNRNGTNAGWNINTDGDLIPSADSTVDIGTNAVRVQNLYADTLHGGVATVSNGIVETAATIATNHTITSNYNAMSAGPVTVSATVTVPSGSVWTVI